MVIVLNQRFKGIESKQDCLNRVFPNTQEVQLFEFPKQFEHPGEHDRQIPLIPNIVVGQTAKQVLL